MVQIVCTGLLTRTGTLQRSLSHGCVFFHVSFRRVSDHHAHTSQLCNSARAIANVAVRATCEPCGSPFVHVAFVQTLVDFGVEHGFVSKLLFHSVI